MPRPPTAQVLEHARSSYLPPFLKLSQLIQQGTEEAVDNLKFLTNLTAPCLKLTEAKPKAIPAILPAILNVTRVVWRHSRFYNTADRLTGLLRKVRTAIIYVPLATYYYVLFTPFYVPLSTYCSLLTTFARSPTR